MDTLNPRCCAVVHLLAGPPPDLFVSRADVCHSNRFRRHDKKYLPNAVGQLAELLFTGSKGSLRVLACGDVADGSQQRWPATQRQCRQADLSRKNIAVLALVQPFEAILAIEKRGRNLLIASRQRRRAIGLVRR